MFQQCTLQQSTYRRQTRLCSRELKRLYKIGKWLFISKRYELWHDGLTFWWRASHHTREFDHFKRRSEAVALGNCTVTTIVL